MKENYNQALGFNEKDPSQTDRNAIRSFATEHEEQLDTAAVSAVAGDRTTWKQHDVERCCEAEKGPLKRHAGLEVEDAMVQAAPQLRVAPKAKDNDSAKSLSLMNSEKSSQDSPRSRKSKTPIFFPATSAP